MPRTASRDQVLHNADTGYLIEEIDRSGWVEQIDRVMKSAYRAEAELLGVAAFPPLERRVEGVATCAHDQRGRQACCVCRVPVTSPVPTRC